MNLTWNKTLWPGVLAVLIGLGCLGNAAAQTFPAKPVRIIVGYGPGSGVDVITRLVTDGLSKAWGQPVVIENRPGASGIVAMTELKKASPDGYTYIIGDLGNMAINPNYYRTLPYDPEKDLITVIDMMSGPFIFFVSRDGPFKSLKDVIAYAKANPGKASYASTGTGSPIYMGTELFKLRAGIDMLQVPYREMGPMLSGVATGEVTLVLTSVATAKPMLDRFRPVAIAAKQRQAMFPDIPTVGEAGGPAGLEVVAWAAFTTLRGTPRAVIDRFHADALRVMQRPEVRERVANLGFTLSVGKTPEEMAAFIRSEVNTYREVVKATGAQADQ